MGASGSGKSTLLHLMGGVDQPTEGRVFVEDEDISTLNPVKAAVFRRRKVGLIYQFYNLIPTLSVEQNIKLPMLLDKRRPDEVYFRGLVAGLGLEDKLKALPGALSGGSSSGLQSPVLSCTARPWFWRMNPPEIWTGRIPGRLWNC